MRDTFHFCFDLAFGGISTMFGLLFIAPAASFFLHLPIGVFRGTRPEWMPYLLLGLAIIGIIELVGGFNKIRRAGH